METSQRNLYVRDASRCLPDQRLPLLEFRDIISHSVVVRTKIYFFIYYSLIIIQDYRPPSPRPPLYYKETVDFAGNKKSNPSKYY